MRKLAFKMNLKNGRNSLNMIKLKGLYKKQNSKAHKQNAEQPSDVPVLGGFCCSKTARERERYCCQKKNWAQFSEFSPRQQFSNCSSPCEPFSGRFFFKVCGETYQSPQDSSQEFIQVWLCVRLPPIP